MTEAVTSDAMKHEEDGDPFDSGSVLRRPAPSSDLDVTIDAYAGPLVDLVDLVDRGKLSAGALDLTDLCAQLDAHLHALPPFDLTNRCAPLPGVARLVQSKGRTLDGQDSFDGEDAERPRDPDGLAFARRAGEVLRARPLKGRDVFGNGRRRRRPDGSYARPAGHADLTAVFAGVLGRQAAKARAAPGPEVTEDEVAADLLRTALAGSSGPVALEVVAAWGSELTPHGARYAAVLRVALDAAREGTVRLHQDERLGPIYASTSGAAPEADDDEDEAA